MRKHHEPGDVLVMEITSPDFLTCYIVETYAEESGTHRRVWVHRCDYENLPDALADANRRVQAVEGAKVWMEQHDEPGET